MRYLPMCVGSAAAPAEASAEAGADSGDGHGAAVGTVILASAPDARHGGRAADSTLFTLGRDFSLPAASAQGRLVEFASMMSAREELLDALRAAMAEVSPGHTLAAAFETPKQADHGDLAVTAAMPLAKAQTTQSARGRGRADRRVARQDRGRALGRVDRHRRARASSTCTCAPRRASASSPRCWPPAPRFGTRPPSGEPVIVEFVSANPTGPLHVGHARQAALGDAICNLLETQGRRVVREFYYNDAGVQIATLAASVKARLDGLKPGDPGWPESAYNGDYIADIAADFAARKTVRADDREFTASGRRGRPRRHPPVRGRLPAPRAGPRPAGVRRALRQLLPRVEPVRERPRRGDRRRAWSPPARPTRTAARSGCAPPTTATTRTASCASPTAATPTSSPTSPTTSPSSSAASRPRSTSRAPTTTARSRACAPACRRPAPACRRAIRSTCCNTMVRVERGGEEVKISKRAGNYVTLRDLIDWTSRDAVRFFMLSRKADTEFTFDVDLALKQNDENPVFYVQYAHARICSVLEQYAAQGGDAGTLAERRPRPPGRAERDRAAAEARRLRADARGRGRRRWRRTRSRSTCASWRRPSTATTAPSDSSSTIPSWRARAWPCWRRRARSSATRSPSSASARRSA